MQELGTPMSEASPPPFSFRDVNTESFGKRFVAHRTQGIDFTTPLGVMVVEDSDSVRAVWRYMISKIAGLSLQRECDHVSMALECLRQQLPDVLLLDIQLRGENGLAVLQAVMDRRAPTKVIVVSNYAEEIYRKHYMQAGAFAFFDKSYGLKALKHLLEHLARSPVECRGAHAI